MVGQISKRVAMISNDRPAHIHRLNAIGRAVPEMHKKWREFMKTNRAKSNVYDAEEQAVALLDIAAQVDKLRRLSDLNKWMSEGVAAVGDKACFGCSRAWRRFKIRLGYGFHAYAGDFWNLLDCVNYVMFARECCNAPLLPLLPLFPLRFLAQCVSCAFRSQNVAIAVSIMLRIIMIPRTDAAVAQIESTTLLEDPWESLVDSSNFINLYRLSFYNQIGTYINAFNSVLTWIKLFKYLNFFPDMRILTATLKVAAVPLGMFSIVMMIVLIGSGQGFFLAFGLDIWNFRSLPSSVLSLLRMAVGDFDYDGLQSSHYILGPSMFWLYIFLMLFILMSMFIALIAESYETAKKELNAEVDQRRTRSVASDDASAVLKVQARTQRVINMMADQNLISWPLEVEMKARLEERYTPTYGEVEVAEMLGGIGLLACCTKAGRLAKRAAKLADAGGLIMQEQLKLIAQDSKHAGRRRESPVDVFSDDSDAEEELQQLLSTTLKSRTEHAKVEKDKDTGPVGPRLKVTVIEARRVVELDNIPDPEYYVICRSGVITQRTASAGDDGSTGTADWEKPGGTVYFDCPDGRPPLMIELRLMTNSISNLTIADSLGEALFPIKVPAKPGGSAWAALREQYGDKNQGWTAEHWIEVKRGHENDDDDVEDLEDDHLDVEGELRIELAWEPLGRAKPGIAGLGGAGGLAEMVLKAKEQYKTIKEKECGGGGAGRVEARLKDLETALDTHKREVIRQLTAALDTDNSAVTAD